MGLQHEVDNMFSQKDALQAQHDQLLLLRQLAREKYTKLYQFVVEASSSQQNQYGMVSACPPEYPHHSIELDLNSEHHSFMVANNSSAACTDLSVASYNDIPANFTDKIDKNE